MNFEKLSSISKYSPKDIMIPSETEYMKKLLIMQEDFGRRICWRAYKIMEDITNENNDEEKKPPTIVPNYGFKSDSKPPIVKEIADFIHAFFDLVNQIEFRKVNDPFLHELKSDVNKMK